MTYSLTDLSTVRALVDVDDNYDQHDAMLWQFALVATSLIAEECGRDFRHQTFTEYLDTRDNATSSLDLSGSSYAYADRINVRPINYALKGFPLTDAESVSVVYDPYSKFDPGTTINECDYVVELSKNKLALNAATVRAERSLRVSYDAGYPVHYAIAGKAYIEEVNKYADVDTSLTGGAGLAALFDLSSAKTIDQCASVSQGTGSVTVVYGEPEHLHEVSWTAPVDGSIHTGATSTTLVLEGSVIGDFTDAQELATRAVPLIMQGKDYLLKNSDEVTLFKAYRVTAQGGAGATSTLCAQINFELHDKTRVYLRDVPEALSQGAALLAKFLWQKNRASGFGMQSDSYKGSTVYATRGAVPPDIAQMIMPYKRVIRGRG